MEYYTDKQFFDISISRGANYDDKGHVNRFFRAVDYLNQFPINSCIEIGAGMGIFGKYFKDYYGIEPNKYFRDYALKNGVILHDSDKVPEKGYDLGVSIEVFEHITDREIDRYLSVINTKYFLFSSPDVIGDPKWGHINCKTEHEWIKLFSKYGYSFLDYPQFPVKWAMMFTK